MFAFRPSFNGLFISLRMAYQSSSQRHDGEERARHMKPETKAKVKAGYKKAEEQTDSVLQGLIAAPITVVVVVIILGLAAYGAVRLLW